MLRSLCIMGAASLCISVRNNRLPDCPFVACIMERLALPRPWFNLIAYIAAKSVRIVTAPNIFRHQVSIGNGFGRRIAFLWSDPLVHRKRDCLITRTIPFTFNQPY